MEEKRFVPDYKNGCAICGNPDHWKNECPEKNTAKDRGFGGRGGRGPPSGSVNSNQLRSQDCNRCKFAPNNINNCIGCKKSSNVDHCLLHCGQYICLGVEERVKLVRNANSCAICLHGGHQSGACGYRDKSNWVCGISGCSSHHHPTLHGSADAYVKINVIQVEQSRFEDVTDWESRADFVQDSFVVNEVGGDVVSVERQEELQQAKQELLKPGLGGDQVLLVIQEVDMVYGPLRSATKIVTFFDDGSTCSIILNSIAKQFGLLGEKVVVTIETINAVTTKETMLYLVELLDREGVRRMVRAFGFDSISEPIGNVELNGIKYLFSQKI